MPSLYLGSRRIDYAVVRGNSRRYTYFRFRPDLTIEVILPRGRVVDVEKALRDRSVWLQHEYEKLSKIKDVLGNDTVMYDGKLLKVVFSQSPGDSLVPDLVKEEVQGACPKMVPQGEFCLCCKEGGRDGSETRRKTKQGRRTRDGQVGLLHKKWQAVVQLAADCPSGETQRIRGSSRADSSAGVQPFVRFQTKARRLLS